MYIQRTKRNSGPAIPTDRTGYQIGHILGFSAFHMWLSARSIQILLDSDRWLNEH